MYRITECILSIHTTHYYGILNEDSIDVNNILIYDEVDNKVYLNQEINITSIRYLNKKFKQLRSPIMYTAESLNEAIATFKLHKLLS